MSWSLQSVLRERRKQPLFCSQKYLKEMVSAWPFFVLKENSLGSVVEFQTGLSRDQQQNSEG